MVWYSSLYDLMVLNVCHVLYHPWWIFPQSPLPSYGTFVIKIARKLSDISNSAFDLLTFEVWDSLTPRLRTITCSTFHQIWESQEFLAFMTVSIWPLSYGYVRRVMSFNYRPSKFWQWFSVPEFLIRHILTWKGHSLLFFVGLPKNKYDE